QALPSERLNAYREQAASLMMLLANSRAQQAKPKPDVQPDADLLHQASMWNQRAEFTHPAPESCRAIWLQRAYIARLRDDTVEAEQLAHRTEAIPRKVDDSYLEGRELMSEGRLVAAQRVLKEATQADPKNFWARFYLASSSYQFGQDWEAAA